MKMQPITIGFVVMLMLSSLTVHAAPPAPVEAKTDICALLTPDDLTTLLGGAPIAKPGVDACSWTASGSTKKLIAVKSPNKGMEAEMTFSTARKNAVKNGPVTKEDGIGDNAFSRLGQVGVVLVMIKQGHLIQMQYRTEAQGTPKDLDMLRPVAKKVIAAF